MREILFRGKSKQSGKWHYGYYQECSYRKRHTPVIFNEKYQRVEVIPETVGQFTGLTDSKGNKIFEGDIIKWCFRSEMIIYEDEPVEENIPQFYYDTVVYMADRLDYSAFDLENNTFECNGLSDLVCSGAYDFEVAGNIHDNPELLEVQNES